VEYKGIRFALVNLLKKLYQHPHGVVYGMEALRNSRAANYTIQRRGRDADQLELSTRVVVVEIESESRRYKAAVESSQFPVLLIGGRVDGVPVVEIESDTRMLWDVGNTIHQRDATNADEVNGFRNLLHTRSRLMRPNVRLFAIFFAIRMKMLYMRVLKRMYDPSGPRAARDRDDFRDDMQMAFGWD
jgi:glutaredoxin